MVYILLGASVVGGALALFVEVSQSVSHYHTPSREVMALRGGRRRDPNPTPTPTHSPTTLVLPLLLTLTLTLTLTLVLTLTLSRTRSRARPARAVPSTAAS